MNFLANPIQEITSLFQQLFFSFQESFYYLFLCVIHAAPYHPSRPHHQYTWKQIKPLLQVIARKLSFIVSSIHTELGIFCKGNPEGMLIYQTVNHNGERNLLSTAVLWCVPGTPATSQMQKFVILEPGGAVIWVPRLEARVLDWIKPRRNLFIPSALNTNQKPCSSLEGAEMQSKLPAPFLSLGGIWKCKALNTNCLNWTYVNLF